MPTLRSHTHLQAAQANAQPKACKRVCLPKRSDTATLDRQLTTEKEGRTHNSRFAKAGLTCFYDSEVQNPSFVHLMKFSAENPRLRKAANR
jgi:hypothetical protein